MNVLQILCHPDFDNKNRVSNILALTGETELKKKGFNNIKTLNLYSPNCYIPVMDKHMFNYENKKLTPKEQKDYTRQKELLAQWKNTDIIFIYMPLHNFNIVSKFKDYIDNIVIVNETFECEIETLIGLDNPDKKIIFVLTSGGEFDSNIQYINLDFTVDYLRGILGVMGINHMQLLRVQGLDLEKNNKERIIETAKMDLTKIIKETL